MIYGYLRVSSDKQDVESQKIGVVKKAEELKVKIEEWITDEGVSGVKDYKKRNLGQLMEKAKQGDIIIVSEISRLARSVFMLFRIVEYCIENDIVIYSVKDSINIIKKGDLTGIMMIFCFGIAAQIEREMIVKRTREGLERRRCDGVIFGRPIGAKSKKKLDGKEEIIAGYFNAGLSICQTARMLNVHRGTLVKFCNEKGIEVNRDIPLHLQDSLNSWKIFGKQIDSILDNEKDFIVSQINEGLIPKQIIAKFQEKGHKIPENSFLRWIRKNDEIYNLLIDTNKKMRKIKNADCGKQKKYYKF
jgi:DNA invertase Pin-like site-specific DNA recombinase